MRSVFRRLRLASTEEVIATVPDSGEADVEAAVVERVPLWNGPIECRLFRFDMVAGSARG